VIDILVGLASSKHLQPERNDCLFMKVKITKSAKVGQLSVFFFGSLAYHTQYYSGIEEKGLFWIES